MVHLYQKLKNLSKEQTKAIQEQNVELLLEIIKQKQDLITKISSLDNSSGKAQLSENDKENIKATILEQIKIDQKNEKDMSRLMAGLKNNLTEIVKCKVAAKSYSPEVTSGPRFFDAAG